MDKNQIIIRKIKGYAEQSLEFLGGLNYEQFERDAKTIAACVMNLSQIGELAGKLDEEFTEKHTNIPWHKMRGMRHRIVHDYEGLRLNIVWEVLMEFLPELIENLKSM